MSKLNFCSHCVHLVGNFNRAACVLKVEEVRAVSVACTQFNKSFYPLIPPPGESACLTVSGNIAKEISR